jgi:peptidyl-prolyl cis-trans isomerase C
MAQIRASHILVKTEEEAKQVLEILEQGNKTFEQIAEERSSCPSKKNGGDLGFFGKQQMVREFENAAFNLKVGEVSQPVKTQFGWHIIKLTDKR